MSRQILLVRSSSSATTMSRRRRLFSSSSSRILPPPPLLTVPRAARLLAAGADAGNDGESSPPPVTSERLARRCRSLAVVGERTLGLNAFTNLLSSEAVARQARASDERRREGRTLGPLDGVPVSIKANIAVGEIGVLANGDPSGGSEIMGLPTAASAMLGAGALEEREFGSPPPDGKRIDSAGGGGESGGGGCGYHSDVSHRLLVESGAVLVGVTNMDEFGMGSLGTHCQPSDHHSGGGRGRPVWPPQGGGSDSRGLVKNPLPILERMRELGLGGALGPEEDTDAAWLDFLLSHDDDVEQLLGDDDPALLTELASLPALSAGGSSSGSASSIRWGSSLLSVGTDTGGSVRLPAAWTGAVGLKPTYGRISRYGVVSYASSLDCVGLLGGTAGCVALGLEALANVPEGNGIRGDDEGDEWEAEKLAGCRDSTSIAYSFRNPLPVAGADVAPGAATADCDKPNSKPLAGLTVGLPAAFSVAELTPSLRSAWSAGAERLRSAGATIAAVPPSVLSPETIKASLAAYYVLASAEASSNLSRYDGIRYGGGGGEGEGGPEYALLPGQLGSGGGDGDDDDNSDTSDADAEIRALRAAWSSVTPLEARIASSRASGFGPEVTRRVLAGTAVLSSDRYHTHYEAAAKLRAELVREFEGAFRGGAHGEEDGNEEGGDVKVDLMLVPTALTPPPQIGGASSGRPLDGTAAFANDVMTVPMSLAGLPSVSVPVRVPPTLGIATEDSDSGGGGEVPAAEVVVAGLQIFGPHLSEETVLRAAAALETEAAVDVV